MENGTERVKIRTSLTELLKIEAPIIGGAMYPCSNPELVAAVSEAGGIGIVQPLSLVYVYKYDFRTGLQKIKSLTSKPIGMNLLIEKSVKRYEDRMKEWLDIALEEGVRFFITALGNPKWVVSRMKSFGGIVFHDVTEKKWALKALEAGVDGLICVNNKAGGHAGAKSPEELFGELKELGKPLICAGGVGDEQAFVDALKTGYAGVQMGTRFIATYECAAHPSYKEAILRARASDIVLTERMTGVPVSVIQTPYLLKTGASVSSLGKYLLQNSRTKHWARTFYSLKSFWDLKRSATSGYTAKDFWQAGKSVEGIETIESVAEIVKRFTESDDSRVG